MYNYNRGNDMRAVYIHIPFCRNICSYCDFCKFLHKEEWARLYLDSLSKEVDKYYEQDMIKSIYIGGGTPSSLSTSNLVKLFSIINKFKKISGAEVTFECNINDINVELLKLLKENGVNRLSIGIESFDDKNLVFLGRKHTRKDIPASIKLCRVYSLISSSTLILVLIIIGFLIKVLTFGISSSSL